MKKKILVVDDVETIGQIIAMYLKDDFEVLWYSNPMKAIAWLLKGGVVDLIISDIAMPEMTGDRFLEYLKQNEMLKHIPVMMLSAEDSSKERIRLLEMGADDYVVKPFNPIELSVRVKKIIPQ